MSVQKPLLFHGAPGSPYTRKMLAILRYRRIAYEVLWGRMIEQRPDLPKPKVALMPTFFFDGENGVEAVVDSSPILRRLETEFSGRSVLPDDLALGFLNTLVEDYGDEWLTKAMFHYRWAFDDDIAHGGPLLAFWNDPTLPGDVAEQFGGAFAQRQVDRLWVVGSNDTTRDVIEQSYVRFLEILDGLIEGPGYVFGTRPSSADFALYGQLTQLTTVDPTPVKVSRDTAPRIRSWVERVDDLSGLTVTDDGFLPLEDQAARLKPLLAEIGRVYAPFLLANAKALEAGAEMVECEIDGAQWTQKAFPYQGKCLMWLREAFGALADADQARIRAVIGGTGIEALL